VIEHALEIAWGTAVLGGIRDGVSIRTRILIQACPVRRVDVAASAGVVCARDGGGEQPDKDYACRGGQGHRKLFYK
jgi:hypothetical protein